MSNCVSHAANAIGGLTGWLKPSQPQIDYLEPLDDDLEADPIVHLSTRQLGRLIFLAAQTAQRFERSKISHDPLAWLFSPRQLFAGENAVTACRGRRAFSRACLFHALELGLDAPATEMERLMVAELAEQEPDKLLFPEALTLAST